VGPGGASFPPGGLPGVQRGFDVPTQGNVDHVAAPKGSKGGADHHDWMGESELDKHEGEAGYTYEGNYTANVHPEEWLNDFSSIWRIDLRIYGKDEESVCRLRQVLTKVVYDGELTTDLAAHWKELVNLDVGLVEETRSFNRKHLCACNCVAPCGALPLPPCAPEIEVRIYVFMRVCVCVCVCVCACVYICVYIYRWMASSWVLPTGECTYTR